MAPSPRFPDRFKLPVLFRERRGVVRLPATPAEQEQALVGSERICAALGEERLQAFLAVRRSDAAWAAERTLEEIVAAHLWRY